LIAKRLHTVVLFLATALAACGGSVATAPPPTFGALTTTEPSSSPEPSAAATPEPTASVDPLERARSEYLALADRVNAGGDAVAALSGSSTLQEIRDAFAQASERYAAGAAGLAEIAFPSSVQPDVDALIQASNTARGIAIDITSADTIDEAASRFSDYWAARGSFGRAANTVRSDLRLPLQPLPSSSPPVIARASPSFIIASPTPSADPAADLKIGAPYTLMPLDPVTGAAVEAAMAAGIGSAAQGWSFAFRWVVDRGQNIAIAMMIQPPGATPLSDPVLDAVAATFSGSSAAPITRFTTRSRTVRLVDKPGQPLAVYRRGDTIVAVIGSPGTDLAAARAIATALIAVDTTP
jgi:hypothetical protein